jgi:SAM-dependent methyltransferase
VSTFSNVLELGSGAGFIKEHIPLVISSEILLTEGVDIIADACRLPFTSNSLDAIVMTDVLHHLPDVSVFFTEANRCIRPGGKMVMIEPWLTHWSTWVYTNLHSEPFNPDGDWTIPDTGPLSGANGALPWILFKRDKDIFLQKYMQWQITKLQPMMPIAYLLSGGVSMRGLLPGWFYTSTRLIERIFLEKSHSMFALIVLEKKA